MTELTKILCPHCGGHVHTLAHIAKQQQQARAAAPPPSTDPNSEASKASNVCPQCQEWKKPGFPLCYNCSMVGMDDCPVDGCTRKKRQQYKTCYQCRQEGRKAPEGAAAATPAQTQRPAGVHPYDDGYPNADMGEDYDTF